MEKRQKNGGRKKDTPNKLTHSARQLFVETLEGEIPNIKQAFKEVKEGVKDKDGKQLTKGDPAVYLNLLAKYAQYFVPKMVDVTTDGDKINNQDLSHLSFEQLERLTKTDKKSGTKGTGKT